MMKRILDKDTRTLVKAGMINGDLEFTEQGKNALESILLTEKKAELVKLAEEKINEDKQ